MARTNWTAYNAADTMVALETHDTREAAVASMAAYVERVAARVVSSTDDTVHLKARDGRSVRVVLTTL